MIELLLTFELCIVIVSKHSRAARRGEVIEPSGLESTKLAASTSTENDGVRKSIIRTQIKNENLLNKKLESSKVRKLKLKKKSSAIKHKLERSDKLQGILSSKIDASIQRAKYVQSARKANWDKINSSIEIRNHILDELKQDSSPKKELTQEEIEKMEEDEYVRKFYEDDENVDNIDKEDKQDGGENKDGKGNEVEKVLSNNRFALLGEVEE